MGKLRSVTCNITGHIFNVQAVHGMSGYGSFQKASAGETPMPYQTIEVKKLTPHIGAEISGVDLSRPLGNQQFQEVHDALMDKLVVFFRDQYLTHEQHKAFAQLVGDLAIHPTSRNSPEVHPES